VNRKVVLATVGTLGDLHPFLALALALRDLGFVPVMACAAEYRAKIEAAGIAFHAVRPSYADVQRELGMDRAELTRQTLAQGRFLFRKLLFPDLRATYDDMVGATANAAVVLTSSLAFAARLAAEKRGIPWLAVVLQPMMFVSAYDPPVLPRVEWLSTIMRRLGPAPRAYVLNFVKAAVGRMCKPVHKLRAEIGLPPTRRNPLADGQFSATGAIGLYSTVIGDVQPDFPQRTVVVGFAFYDSEDGAAARLDPQLRAWLDDGDAPLVFTLGSLIVNSPGTFFRESLDAARRLRRRAVLLVGGRGAPDLSTTQGEGICIRPYVPYSMLFPRAAAIVHQGGVGTLAQALAAGRPQLIVPFIADQLDNAARAERIGVARTISPDRYTAATAAAELEALLGDARYERRARDVGTAVGRECGAVRGAIEVSRRLTELRQRGAA
jgi:UDP:flavonoid glycosyltransferase YjiC (YdhE family)